MSDIVERLRSDGEDERQRFREARATLGPLLADAADRIAQLETALRAVMDDLTLIGENNWLPVGLLEDVIYVNALAALEERT